jgi:hypothetical protein
MPYNHFSLNYPVKTMEITRLRAALLAEGIASDAAVRVINRMSEKKKADPWLHLKQPLHAAIRTTSLSRARWRPTRIPTYEAYLQLMRRVQAEISNASRDHATPADYAKVAAAINAQRVSEGKRPLGDCLSHWSTWVPPHIREATILAFEKLYADETAAKLAPGRRITPFSTLTQRHEALNKWDRLLTQLQPHLDAGYEVHPAYLELNTRGMYPEQAEKVAHALQRVHRERYRAAYAARKIIETRRKQLTTDMVVPLHWVHVLDEDARTHLREAERAAGGDGYTRDTGGMSAKAPTATVATLAPGDDFEIPEIRATRGRGFDTPGYIAPRPDDKRTAAAAQAQSAIVKRQQALNAQRQAGDDEWERRLREGDL